MPGENQRSETFAMSRPVSLNGPTITRLPDGSTFEGVSGLEHGLLGRPEIFVGTLTEKLLTYALGRGVEPSDAPAVRRIVRESQGHGFRFSSLILGVVNSPPFRMRRSL